MKRQDILANRKSELAMFRAMLRGDCTERILILHAPSSKGKSSLIRHLRRECANEWCVVHIDFKDSGIGLARGWMEFQASLVPDMFRHFAAVSQILPTPHTTVTVTSTVSETMAGGNANINVAPFIEVDNPQTRADNIARLSEAFFTDLRTVCNNLVVILDTFEKAPTEMKEWINGTFLPFVPRLPGLCVVLAGQEVPPETSATWGDLCERSVLGNIDSLEEWYDYAREAGLPHPQIAVAQTVFSCKGDPALVVETLSNTVVFWSGK
jgi:hypothetical protein